MYFNKQWKSCTPETTEWLVGIQTLKFKHLKTKKQKTTTGVSPAL